MKHRGTVWLETERLILRRFTLGDTEEAYRNYCLDTNEYVRSTAVLLHLLYHPDE